MISLSGFKENDDIDIVFSGLKPGEKLYEEVQHLNEVHTQTDHPRIFRFIANQEAELSLDEVSEKLMRAVETHDTSKVKDSIKSIISEYSPSE
jgi:FlaA1/EpsC-like NDP-sugar epimerase